MVQKKFLIVVFNSLRKEEGHQYIIKELIIELKITELINVIQPTKERLKAIQLTKCDLILTVTSCNQACFDAPLNKGTPMYINGNVPL